MLYKFLQWLRDHSPIWCVRCRYLMFAKNAHYRSTTTGFLAVLCAKCEHELYHPWEK